MRFFGRDLKKATPEDDQKLKDAFKENEVGFKDVMAMLFSAFFMLVLPCLVILMGISLLCLWLFGML